MRCSPHRPHKRTVLQKTSSPYQAPVSRNKVRVAVFGSFMGGYHLLRELLLGPLTLRTMVVGVATDDPHQPFTHARKRLWKYPHTRDDELLVPRFGVPWF